MDASAEAMVSAVEEVNSVAEELRGLREKIKQYGDASIRLNNLGDVLKELTTSVGHIQGAFTSALEQVKVTQAHAESGKKSVEQLVGSIPDVVKRIEATDISGVVTSFAGSMNEVGGLLRLHEKSLNEIVNSFADERASHDAALHDLTELVEKGIAALSNLSAEVRGLQESSSQGFQMLRLLKDVVCDEVSPKILLTQDSVLELRRLVDQVQQGSNRAADGMADYATKMLREMSSMREELGSAHKLLAEQGQKLQRQGGLLDEISKRKKGWFS